MDTYTRSVLHEQLDELADHAAACPISFGCRDCALYRCVYAVLMRPFRPAVNWPATHLELLDWSRRC